MYGFMFVNPISFYKAESKFEIASLHSCSICVKLGGIDISLCAELKDILQASNGENRYLSPNWADFKAIPTSIIYSI